MKNLPNLMLHIKSVPNITLYIISVPHVVAFEVAAFITSALVIVTSSLVIKYIYGKKRRSRTDLLFITLSVSDIGVGLIRIPLLGIFVACGIFVKCSASIYYFDHGTYIFPYFSCLVTTVIAVDRLLVITKNYDYKKIVTRGRLAMIVAFCFGLATVLTFLSGYNMFYRKRYSALFISIPLCINVIPSLILFVAYVYILFYVHGRSVAVSHCKVSGNNYNKKLNKTIMLILVFHVILVLPAVSLEFAFLPDIAAVYPDLKSIPYYKELYPWFNILWFCLYFINGIIFLINQRKKARKVEIKPVDVHLKTF